MVCLQGGFAALARRSRAVCAGGRVGAGGALAEVHACGDHGVAGDVQGGDAGRAHAARQGDDLGRARCCALPGLASLTQ